MQQQSSSGGGAATPAKKHSVGTGTSTITVYTWAGYGSPADLGSVESPAGGGSMVTRPADGRKEGLFFSLSSLFFHSLAPGAGLRERQRRRKKGRTRRRSGVAGGWRALSDDRTSRLRRGVGRGGDALGPSSRQEPGGCLSPRWEERSGTNESKSRAARGLAGCGSLLQPRCTTLACSDLFAAFRRRGSGWMHLPVSSAWARPSAGKPLRLPLVFDPFSYELGGI